MSDDVEDEVKEGVWGYLLPLDSKYGDKPLVLKRRNACPLPDCKSVTPAQVQSGDSRRPETIRAEEAYEATKVSGVPSGGFLIGRHPECGTFSDFQEIISPFVRCEGANYRHRCRCE